VRATLLVVLVAIAAVAIGLSVRRSPDGEPASL